MAGVNSPTVAGFLVFIRNVMAINTTVLPDSSPYIGWAFAAAMQIVNPNLGLGIAPPPLPAPYAPAWTIYQQAVYNLGGDTLINIAQDQTGLTYFAKLRGPISDGGFGCGDFMAGVVESTSDVSTATSLAIGEGLKNLMLSDLANLKTPWGRAYLSLAMSYGNLWGVT